MTQNLNRLESKFNVHEIHTEMNGADNFIRSIKRQLKKRIYHTEFIPEFGKCEPLDNRTISQIQEETGTKPSMDIRIYKPTGRRIYGYYEYIHHKTITI